MRQRQKGYNQINADPLESIPATRMIVDNLFASKLISTEARERGIELLYSPKNWGLWASKFLSTLGIALVLSGLIYFFAFNEIKMHSAIKFVLIQVGIIGCIMSAFFNESKLLRSKLSLLSAGVLVGVFLATFGQVYPTGADSFNLFMMWALLILPWVIISNFSFFWILWLIISNIALNLVWEQAVLPSPEGEKMIFCYLISFNGFFLIIRELLFIKGVHWLQNHWTRIVLVIAILLIGLFPTLEFIVSPLHSSYSIILGTLFSIFVHLIFYFFYRYIIPDIWTITATLFSTCIIFEFAIYEMLIQLLEFHDYFLYLLMGTITPIIFTLAILTLRIISKEIKKNYVSKR